MFNMRKEKNLLPKVITKRGPQEIQELKIFMRRLNRKG